MKSSNLDALEPKRPKSVWFLTIYMGLFNGILPFGVALFFSFNEPAQIKMGIDFTNFIFPMVLGIIITLTAIGTWQGNNKARIAFLVAITIHHGLLIYQNYQLIQLASNGLLDSDLIEKSWVRIFGNAVWVIIYWLYFSSEGVKPFFTRPNKIIKKILAEFSNCSACGETLRKEAIFCHKCGLQQKPISN